MGQFSRIQHTFIYIVTPRPIKGHMFNCFCKYQTITWQRFSAIGRAEMVKTTSWSSTEENEQRLVDVRDQRRMATLLQAITQLTICYNLGMQKITSLNAHVKACRRWCTTAEGHSGCCSCQVRTGNFVLQFTQTHQNRTKKIGKTIPDLMSIDF